MLIWVRIKNLPFGLMNKSWGEELAGKIGKVEKVDADSNGRAWGPYLRAKVRIDITKPLRRGVSIFSVKRQKRSGMRCNMKNCQATATLVELLDIHRWSAQILLNGMKMAIFLIIWS